MHPKTQLSLLLALALALALYACGHVSPMNSDFYPVVALPAHYDVLDFTIPEAQRAPRTSPYSIGRYGERRSGLYTQPLFAGRRDVHMGLDIGGPAGTAIRAYAPGVVLHAGHNPADGDYGYVIVVAHQVPEGFARYALYGHLSKASITHSPVGRALAAGDLLGWMGAEDENGGWPPHLHFQLARERPITHDLPGAVSAESQAAAMEQYPDPRTVLGPIY